MSFLDKLKGNADKDITKGSSDDLILPDYGEVRDTRSYDSTLMFNNGVDICARACAVCWDTKLPDSYDERSKYIGKRAKIGHTSVMEHSNLVLYMEIYQEDHDALIQFLDGVDYLNYRVRQGVRNPNKYYMILGGTWRGFADLYLNEKDLSNPIMMRVTNMVYNHIPADALRNIIGMGCLEEGKFANINLSQAASMYNIYQNRIYTVNENIDIINCDNIDSLVTAVNINCPEPELFTIGDLLKFCTITVNFKNMSRIITQQLTRHRNGITQESQRYVNYSKGMFNSPAKFKPDKYDPNHKYPIKFGGKSFNLNLQELGDAIVGIYSQLIDKSGTNARWALQLEDARAYLPSNVRCNTIYITFTWSSFFSFLYLREDPHAQAEMRGYGQALGKWFRETFQGKYDDVYAGLNPKNQPDETIWYRNIRLISDTEEDQSNLPYEEIMTEHIENYDEEEDKRDPVVEDTTETPLKHGEM